MSIIYSRIDSTVNIRKASSLTLKEVASKAGISPILVAILEQTYHQYDF